MFVLCALGAGASILVAYCHCIAHGYDLALGCEQQKLAVQTGYWPLFRFNPKLAEENKNPLQLDSKAPALPLEKYTYNETRYTMLAHSEPEAAKKLLELNYIQKSELEEHQIAFERHTPTAVMLLGLLQATDFEQRPDGEKRAIFSALKQDANLVYVNSPLNLGQQAGQVTQRVRLPTESLAAGGSANITRTA